MDASRDSNFPNSGARREPVFARGLLAQVERLWSEAKKPDLLALVASESPHWKRIMPTQILITEFMDSAAVDQLRRKFEVIYEPDLCNQSSRLRLLARYVDGLIVRNRTQVNAELLGDFSELKVIGRLGVGLDNIDLDTCRARGIRVIPATGANARAVAEYVVATALVLLRGAYYSSADVGAGKWPRTALSEGREAYGKQLGLLGFGSIGQTAGKLAHALGMTVVAYDPLLDPDDEVWRESGARPMALETLLETSDVVSVHVPITSETRSLLDSERLARMKQGAVLINTARGGIVDEFALIAALRAGRLSGAALDVFEDEPVGSSSRFENVPNLILTPHIAGLSQESNVRVSALIGEAVALELERASNG